jgi:O-antigen ligase
VGPNGSSSAEPPPGGRPGIATFADTAAFAVVIGGTIAVPLVFSIALSDVFAVPKAVLTALLATLLAFLLIVRWVAMGRRIRTPSALAIAIVFYVSWNLVAFGLAVNPWHALVGERFQFQGLATSLAYVLFLVAAMTTIRIDRRRLIFLVAVAVAGGLVASYALVQRAGLDPIWSGLPDDRVFSTLGNATGLAAYLALAFPLVAALAVNRGWRWRSLAIAEGAIVVAALFFTLSRGGFLGLAAGAATLAIGSWWARPPVRINGRGVAVVGATSLLAAVLVAALPGPRAAAGRIVERALLTADLTEGSSRMHLDQWAVGAAIVRDHPLVGTGQDTYVLMFDHYRDDVLAPDRAELLSLFRPESPHNVYLAIAGGAGIPALLAYTAIVGAAAFRMIAGIRSAISPLARIFAAASLAAVVAHLVTDTFMTAETSASVLFWSVLGAGAVACMPTASASPSHSRELHGEADPLM